MDNITWRVTTCTKDKLETTLNDLTTEGWHIWPQMVFWLGNLFTVVTSREIEEILAKRELPAEWNKVNE